MKIGCPCGATIHDQTDALPHKAHLIPDQDWFVLLDAIDEAIEESGPSAAQKEAAVMKVRRLIAQLSRLAWQCSACGRLFLGDSTHQPRMFLPGADDVPREIFRRRQADE